MVMELAEAFRTGTQTPDDHLEQCLRRIAERDNQLRAWVSVDAAGARYAAAESTARWRSGRPLGRLDGIPVGVKDIIDLDGQVTSVGVDGWSDEPARADAAIVARLREVGAVVAGKTVTTPFACFDPPPTCHPKRSNCTPGGSSSGSAVSVADGHVPWALGSQTGGSIVRPAAYCGIVGFKPTFGRLPTEGVFPIAPHLDHLGFLCRDAHSACVIWETLAGEPVTLPNTLKVGLLDDVQRTRAESQLLESFRRVVERCREAGLEAEPVVLPFDWGELLQCHGTIMAKEAAQTHARWYAQRRPLYRRGMVSLLERGRSVSSREYEDALERQRAWKAELERWWGSAGVDLLVMLSTPTTAPSRRDTTGDPSFNSPWSLLGVPTLTIPVGRAADGLPVGLQWIGRSGRDVDVLGAGWWCRSRGVCRP